MYTAPVTSISERNYCVFVPVYNYSPSDILSIYLFIYLWKDRVYLFIYFAVSDPAIEADTDSPVVFCIISRCLCADGVRLVFT